MARAAFQHTLCVGLSLRLCRRTRLRFSSMMSVEFALFNQWSEEKIASALVLEPAVECLLPSADLHEDIDMGFRITVGGDRELLVALAATEAELRQ